MGIRAFLTNGSSLSKYLTRHLSDALEDSAFRIMNTEEDLELAQTKHRVATIDWEMQLVIRRLAIFGFSIGICLYCLFFCSDCLLGVMVISACFCQLSPILLFPFFCSLAFFIGSHLPTVEQIFTISADIYEFHEKYK